MMLVIVEVLVVIIQIVTITKRKIEREMKLVVKKICLLLIIGKNRRRFLITNQ